MPQKSSINLPCPICKKKVKREGNDSFPFCTERCKLIDLGAWLDGKYAIEDEGSMLGEEDLEQG